MSLCFYLISSRVFPTGTLHLIELRPRLWFSACSSQIGCLDDEEASRDESLMKLMFSLAVGGISPDPPWAVDQGALSEPHGNIRSEWYVLIRWSLSFSAKRRTSLDMAGLWDERKTKISQVQKRDLRLYNLEHSDLHRAIKVYDAGYRVSKQTEIGIFYAMKAIDRAKSKVAKIFNINSHC